MSAPEGEHGRCHVIDGGKLPPESGGAAAICSAVEHAIAARTPDVAYAAKIRVLSKSGLAATLVSRGRTLPDLHFSVSDRNLNPASIERFAAGVAEHLAKATE